MVANITKGNSIKGVLRYNHDKLNKGEASILYSQKVLTAFNGEPDINFIQRSFETYLLNNRRTEEPVFHVSLNPHPKDKITNEQYTEIAKEYMNLIGFGKQPYVVYKHEDIDRHHIHIVSLQIDENGKKLNDSFELYRSKRATNSIEEKYNLLPSNEQKENKAVEFKPVDYEAGNVKKQIASITKILSEKYNFQSLTEYRALLSLYNLTCEEIKGEIKGKPFAGLSYSCITPEGLKIGTPYKASLFNKSAGYRGIQETIKKSKPILKDAGTIKQIATKVTGCLATARTIDDFKENLKNNGIDIVVRKNEQGRIYGITYIDHINKNIFNGSRIGKQFSANSISQYFNNPQQAEQPQSQQQDQSQPTEHNITEGAKTSNSKTLGGLFDLLGSSSAPNADDEEIRKKKKLPKKKKFKLR